MFEVREVSNSNVASSSQRRTVLRGVVDGSLEQLPLGTGPGPDRYLLRWLTPRTGGRGQISPYLPSFFNQISSNSIEFSQIAE